MSATNPFEELGMCMEEEITTLMDAGYRVSLRRNNEIVTSGLVAGDFSVRREVTGSRLFRATLTLDGALDVRLGSPNEDTRVRRYRASETDHVWQLLSDHRGDTGPLTSRALADAWGQELRELLESLNRPRGHLGAIVTTEE